MGGCCQNVAARWASQDREGALTAILSLEQGPVRDAALRGFTSGLRNNEVVASAGVGKWVEPFSIKGSRESGQNPAKSGQWGHFGPARQKWSCAKAKLVYN